MGYNDVIGFQGMTMHTETMNVSGMQCGGCSIKISLALKETDGIEDVQVSLASGKVTVRYDDGRISPSKLREIVTTTGFGVDGTAATNGHDPRPNCCG
jgi:copper chaperone